MSTIRPVVKIRHINFFEGFDDHKCRSHVLMDLCDEFDFVFCDMPDILLVGCYGQQDIPSGKAVKVGYYTENLAPDLINFDFFFGCEYSHHIKNPHYCKRVFGPLQTDILDGCPDPEKEFRQKTRFCNFIYSTRVPHRERFFKALSRYRKISAPGKSMQNCNDLAGRASEDWQEQKIRYLRTFKFTIAFENSRRVGYATEKLYDAFRADTIPIYWGDPCIDKVVNRDAIVIVDGDWEADVLPFLRLPEKRQPFRPYFRDTTFLNRVFGRSNELIHWVRARLPYTKSFEYAIEQVISLDQDDDAYVQKLSRPRLKDSVQTIRREYFDFWRKIIRHALNGRS
jgi:hypothetical protein